MNTIESLGECTIANAGDKIILKENGNRFTLVRGWTKPPMSSQPIEVEGFGLAENAYISPLCILYVIHVREIEEPAALPEDDGLYEGADGSVWIRFTDGRRDVLWRQLMDNMHHVIVNTIVYPNVIADCTNVSKGIGREVLPMRVYGGERIDDKEDDE